MSKITLKAIEELLDTKLDEKLDTKLKPIKDTIANIKDTMANLATSEELNAVLTKFNAMEKTLSSHTAALVQLLTTKKTKDDEKTVSADRFDRLEHWAMQVGEKIGVKLEV